MKIEKLRNPYVRGNEGCSVSMIDLLEKINEIIDAMNGEHDPADIYSEDGRLIAKKDESEGERIRKEIVECIETIIKQPGASPRLCDWLAYLEKQKEPENTSASTIIPSCWECEQKEQKPAEKQDYSGLNDLERAIHRGFLVAGVENVPVTIIKETAQDCLAHLPVEWSEEDEKRMDSIINILCCYKANLPTKNQLFNVSFQGEVVDADIAWLKSLRPSWKPSEMHLSALLAVFNDPDNIGSQTCQLALTDLYEQLKKL